MANISSSLFEPAGGSSLQGSIEWINGMLFGGVALGLCVIAVAIIGLIMLSGRLPVRRGMQVAVGCFVLLGAPAIAASFTGFWQETRSQQKALPAFTRDEPVETRTDLPPAQYDPYAGASLRSD